MFPNLNKNPLHYVFEDMKLQQDGLWLEFGVFSGESINYISNFTTNTVYGFDSFEGLPEKWRPGYEKGMFSLGGHLPKVNKNISLIKGWFNETLEDFIKNQNQKISFIHIDCDLYSSTKYVLDTLKDHLAKDCVIVFDEFINYDGYEHGEFKAFQEFNPVSYSWIGMNGTIGMEGKTHENVAVIIHSVQ